MKLPFTIDDLRLTIEKKSPPPVIAGRRACADTNHQSSIVNHKSTGGFALVITLILLSVTLIMAVAFLAISQRERHAVTTTTDTFTARLAADAALANAEAQIISSVLATTNPYINNLLVSTNYINTQGFTPGVGNLTNVSYVYANGTPVNAQDFLINLTKLFYLPRAPVYVPTNNLGSNDFRFYLDLNRNGKFEDSGPQPQVDSAGLFIHSDGTADSSSLVNVLTNFMVGDPQWIGVLERPDAPHGPNNKFLARYAFIALPADSTLDLNYIHNQALNQNLSAGDGYFRNQGVGSWELNLAAFFTDLNNNQWDTIAAPYNYRQWMQPAFPNNGNAFDDAREMLMYRYNYDPANPGNYIPPQALSTVLPNFEQPGPPFSGPVDIFPLGPLMTGTGTPLYTYNTLKQPWAGADNTNHFFVLTSDLFDPAKVERNVTAPTPGFIERLNQASTNNSTYDRYTYYRLLAQLGTDSSPESGKMNLNYDNLDPFLNGFYNTNGTVSLTNFAAWTPLAFFTNAADRMLRLYTTNWFEGNSSGFYTNYTTVTNLIYVAPSNYLATYYGIQTNYFSYVDSQGRYIWNAPSGFGMTNLPLFGMTNQIPAFGITNIPVYVNGHFVYSSAVQRVLQLAANIYDASVTNFYPSVFRPLFNKDALGTITIIGYTNLNSSAGLNTVSGTGDLQLSIPFDAATIAALSTGLSLNLPALDNIYGVPWIIGAKKGFPNFNKFTMMNVVQVTRKLQVTRPSINTVQLYNQNHLSKYFTNQLYVFNISNSIGVEYWNSYATNYPRPLQVVARDNIQMLMTNDSGFAQPIASFYTYPTPFSISSNFTVSAWSGATWNSATLQPTNSSFFIPLEATAVLLTNSVYYFGTTPPGVQGFYPEIFDLGWETNLDSFPFPHFGLLTTNQLQTFLLDGNHVIDYVQFSGPNSSRDLNAELANPDRNNLQGLWQTNAAVGIGNQILLSRGLLHPNNVPPEDGGKWKAPPVSGISTVPQMQAYFNAFFSGNNVGAAPAWSGSGGGGAATETNLALSMQVPFTPTRTMYQFTTWQANDPLVHYLVSDLNYFDTLKSAPGVIIGTTNADGGLALKQFPGIGSLNDRYAPWGNVHFFAGSDTNIYNYAYKDPLITSSDNWAFPTNKYPTVGWLGRVHRGTPWQTVFLKATNILALAANGVNGLTTWTDWTGNFNTNDAVNTRPTQDYLLFDIFSTAVNDNATRGRLSVNVAANTNNPAAGLAAWSALFSGMAVPTSLTNTFTVINPAGAAGVPVPAGPPASANSPFCLGYLVQNGTNGINDVRAKFKNPDGLVGAFEHVGNILAVPALTEQSPFLTGLNPNTQKSDALMEWLPQQTMSLLRADGNPRYVIYCYGQTLTPAPNGIVTSGGQAYFGMVNYQVVAETATRAVVQFNPVVVTNSLVPLVIQTNYNATIEQFNPLPPD
jgi:hypothetical protein